MSSSLHEIVVLGGNLAGVQLVHYLLRKTIPSLQKLNKTKSYHLTLITPNTHLFFKIGSPRALIPGEIPEEKIFRPLSEGFKQYGSEKLTLVQGTATSLDPAKRSVTVDGSKEYHYDSIIISTGTTSPSPLWTLHTDQSLTTKAWKSMHAKLPKVKSVLIAGGGAVGVETSGEIASNYKSAKVTLLSGGKRLLPRVLEATGARAEAYLKNSYGAEVIHNVRVESIEPKNANTDFGEDIVPTTVKLTDGSTRTVDLYIDATGGRPNTEFLPTDWLDSSSRVSTRDNYFRVKGNLTDDVSGVYVLGDIADKSNMTALVLEAQVATISSSIAVDIAETLSEGKPAGRSENKGLLGLLFGFIFGSGDSLKQAEYKPLKDTIVVPIGKGGGVGQVMGWKMPSVMVSMAKGKSFLVEMVEPILTGSKIPK